MISKKRLRLRCIQLVCFSLLIECYLCADPGTKTQKTVQAPVDSSTPSLVPRHAEFTSSTPEKLPEQPKATHDSAETPEDKTQDGEVKLGNKEESSETGNNDPKEAYQRLFHHKRVAHMEAVKSIIGMGSYEKQYKMLSILLEKLFSVITDGKVKLMESGFLPGDPFPTDADVREAYSNVAENTAFFGDILLHMPDMTHGILEYHHDWDVIIRWSVGFCNESNVYVGSDLKMLHLMSQELQIIEKDPDYFNPYKAEAQRMEVEIEKEEMERKKQDKKKQKRKEKMDKKKRGPRLSGVPVHSEL